MSDDGPSIVQVEEGPDGERRVRVDFNTLARQLSDDAWREVLDRAKEGDHPPGPELEKVVERHGVPRFPRRYVAARWRGDIDLGPGRSSFERWERAASTLFMVRLLEAAFKLQGLSAPKTRARRVVASINGVESETIRKREQRGLRDAPASYDALRNLDATVFTDMVKDYVSAGLVRLDPESGWVQLVEWDEWGPRMRDGSA